MSSSCQQQNITALYRYNFFTSISISAVGCLAFMDQLLLKLDFAPSRLAFAKSAIFIVPALAYQLFAPCLQSLNRDREICMVSYALRCLIPLSLPIVALMNPGETVLFWTSTLVFGVSFTLACFANNTLMVLYSKILPPKQYNQYAANIYLFFNVPALLTTMVASMVVDRFVKLPPRDFCLRFLALELATIAFQVPAIISLWKLKASGQATSHRFSWRDYLAPLFDRQYRLVLSFISLRSLWRGLLVGLTSVYFLQHAGYSLLKLTAIGTVMSFSANLLTPVFGRLADRHGYHRWLLFLTSLLLVATLGFVIWPHSLAAQLLFLCLLGYDISGLCSILTAFLAESAAAHYARPEATTSYIATYSFLGNLMSFAGCLLSGILFRMLSERFADDATAFMLYFASSAVFLVAMLLLLAIRPARPARPAK